jgi:hypothetical protein
MVLGTVAMLTFFYRDVIANYLTTQFSQPITWGEVAIRANALMANTADGNMLTITAVYSAVTLLIVASTGFMTMRFVRHR